MNSDHEINENFLKEIDKLRKIIRDIIFVHIFKEINSFTDILAKFGVAKSEIFCICCSMD